VDKQHSRIYRLTRMPESAVLCGVFAHGIEILLYTALF